MRLWHQLALVMALLAVVPAAVLGWLAIVSVDEEWRQASALRVRDEARRRADDLGDWLERSRGLVQVVPALFRPDARGEFSPEMEAGLLRLVHGIVSDARVVVLVDGAGRPVVDAFPADEATDGLLAELPTREAIERSGRVHVGTPWMTDAGPVVPLAVQFSDGPGGPRVLGALLDVPVVPAGKAQGVGLLRADGMPLAVSGPLVDPAELAPFLGGVEEFEVVAPEPARGALATVEGTAGWTVAVVEPERALLRLSQRIRGQILIGVLLASGLGVLAAVGTALTVSRPIELLRGKALQLADGALGVRVDVRRDDEIGALAAAFDHLSIRLRDDQARIAEQRTEIEAFNAELQSRVEERTRQLREAQEQLVRTGQLAAVAELGAGLAHDLNNPLTGVLGIAQVLKARHPEDALIASLEHEAQRCRDVVNAMHRAATLEVDAAPSQTDIVAMVRQAVEWVAASYAQRGVTLAIRTPEGSVEASVDPDHGTRILAQILQSVRSGLPEGSTVTVSVTEVRPDDPSPGPSPDPSRSSKGADDAPRDRPAITIEADRQVAVQPQHHDDWLTASRVMWVTVQLIDRLGGVLLRPEEGRIWQWVL